jgi:hypothetical protein
MKKLTDKQIKEIAKNQKDIGWTKEEEIEFIRLIKAGLTIKTIVNEKFFDDRHKDVTSIHNKYYKLRRSL